MHESTVMVELLKKKFQKFTHLNLLHYFKIFVREHFHTLLWAFVNVKTQAGNNLRNSITKSNRVNSLAFLQTICENKLLNGIKVVRVCYSLFRKAVKIRFCMDSGTCQANFLGHSKLNLESSQVQSKVHFIR